MQPPTSISWKVRPSSLARLRKSQVQRLISPVPAGINDALVGRLTDGLPENYLQGLKELYINFHGRSPSPFPLLDASPRCCICSWKTAFAALEPRLFTTRSPRSFFTLYAPPDGPPEQAVARWEDDIGWTARSVSRYTCSAGAPLSLT